MNLLDNWAAGSCRWTTCATPLNNGIMSTLMLLPGVVSLTTSCQTLGGDVLELSHQAARFLKTEPRSVRNGDIDRIAALLTVA